jgi:hypothetical protein
MDPMDRLQEMILPLYKNYSTVQRRVIVAQNIAKFTMGRQEVSRSCAERDGCKLKSSMTLANLVSLHR